MLRHVSRASTDADAADDQWWYWYGPLAPLRLPLDWIGVTAALANVGWWPTGSTRVYTRWAFPLLFLAHAKDDRIAFTRAFLDDVARRGAPRCVARLDAPAHLGHFFPSRDPAWVMERVLEWQRGWGGATAP